MGFVRRVISSALDLANLAKHNANFADIETDLTDHRGRIATVETEQTAQSDRIDNIVASGGESNVEIVDAREDYGTLRERLDTEHGVVTAQLAAKAAQEDLIYAVTRKPYLVVIGDSTAKGGTNGASMAMWLSMMLKREIINNAVWGSWVVDVRNRLKEDVLDLHPEYCLMLMGTNPIHGGESRDITLGHYEYILDTLITNGIKPIVLSVLPRGDFPGDNAAIRIFNSCLLHMCQEKSIRFVDMYNTLAKEDGTPLDYVLHNADNLHWATYGALLGAREVAKCFEVPTQNNIDYPFNLFKGEYPILENGIFTLDTNADGLANSWTAVDTSHTTFSLIDNPSGGKRQVITKTSTTVGTSGIYQTIGALTENATYRFQCGLEFTLTDRTDGGANNANVAATFEFFNSGGTSIGSIIVDEIWYATGIPFVKIYKDFSPPAGTSTTRFTVRGNATSPFELKIDTAYINVIR